MPIINDKIGLDIKTKMFFISLWLYKIYDKVKWISIKKKLIIREKKPIVIKFYQVKID
jgi:hypothetical protein